MFARFTNPPPPPPIMPAPEVPGRSFPSNEDFFLATIALRAHTGNAHDEAAAALNRVADWLSPMAREGSREFFGGGAGQ